MKQAAGVNPPPRMSDEAVQAKTGKTWAEWFAILDKAGARKLDHKAIAALVENHGVPGWWCQMVTVAYEQARGMRAVHEKADGYSISRSKTIPVPVARLFEAFNDPKARAQWLKEPRLVVRKATPHKSIRITWSDGATSVEVGFYEKGPGKSQVAVQHSKLADAQVAEERKAYWGERLERLQAWLER
jgi:uncharacterized protein YndB with AHSA1/START domain